MDELETISHKLNELKVRSVQQLNESPRYTQDSVTINNMIVDCIVILESLFVALNLQPDGFVSITPKGPEDGQRN